ncbi:MAG TPA: O-antigen ligase family protein [Flexivirga sp.]|uniref:O-antigen ligase family protein n=1 Tax=Flexivirga sp. TaxID=1962927 RepID=UPI002C96F820|nr:O-antigen ligase family protein [Flexivirga sp.]HWC23440.1 O-antigen ligase family protein [Flexivirga sp.]
MTTDRVHELLGHLRVVSLVVLVLVTAVAVGYLLPHHPLYAVLIAAAAAFLGLSAVEPALIPVALLPAMLVAARASGIGSNGVTFADLALALALVPGLLLAPRPFSPTLRSLLWLAAAYLAAFAVAVAANPFRDNVIEWFHELVLVMGSLIVGWTIGRRGFARLALLILVTCAAVVAAIVVVDGLLRYATGRFSPVDPSFFFSGGKNYLGTTIGFIAVVCAVHPPWMRLGRWATPLLVLCGVAIAMTQSRQAIVGLAAAILVAMVRRGERRRSALLPLVAVPAVIVSALTLREQLKSDNSHNSAHVRLQWFGDALDVWRHDPLFGAGQRWWYSDRFAVNFQPPNAELEVLSTTGLLGLAAFLLLLIGSLVVTSRLKSSYGTLALAVLVDRAVQGQLDIFWLSVTASLPLLIAGTALGAHEHEHEETRDVVAERTTHHEALPV